MPKLANGNLANLIFDFDFEKKNETIENELKQILEDQEEYLNHHINAEKN